MAEYTTKLAEDEVLRLENLSIHFGGLKAVDDLSFAIKEKEIFGLIGPNGAGKTTAFNCITQFYKPSSGAVYFRNKDGQVENLVGQPVHSIIRKGLVRTFQNVELVGELSIIDNVLIGGHIDFKASGFEQALRLPRARREEKQMREKAEDVLRFMGIAELKDNIYQVREKYGCTILLVEHDMRLVMSICDRICAISFGKFLACGTPSEIQGNAQVQEAYLGEKEE